jgi:membrane protease YdiL (CAAX protease family)
MAALGEELFCRGFLFQRLLAGLGVWPAQLLMAAFFVVTHWHNPGMSGAIKLLASLNVFVASILFGRAFLRTRRLALPLGIHWFANWTQGGLLGLAVSGHASIGVLTPSPMTGPDWLTGGPFGLEASIPGLGCVLGMTLVLARYPPLRPAPG